MTLYQIIKAVQTASGSKAKQAVLEAHKDNELLQKYLKAVYDPRINYFITKLPKVQREGDADFTARLVEMVVGQLAGRKVAGNFAKWFLQDLHDTLGREGQELLSYIIKRDIKAGIAEGTVLKVWPSLFFIPPYQRCASQSDKVKAKFAAMPYFFVQTKSDGQFCYAIKRSKTVSEAMTRAGSIHPTWLAEHVCKGVPEGHVAMGELVIYQNGSLLNRQTGNGILNAILQGDEKGKYDPQTMEIKFLAWDMVTVAEFEAGKSDRRYEDRLHDLHNNSACDTIASWLVTELQTAYNLQTKHLEKGLEGTVWKSPDMKWRDCSSGDPDMMKAKLVFEADFEIESVFEGEGKYVGMAGGFRMKSLEGKIKFNVGTGFSDADRVKYWNERESMPGMIAAIEGNDIITSKGKDTESVFLPVLKEVRLDKKVADSYDRVWEQLKAAKLGK